VLFFTLYMALVYAPFQVLGPAVARDSLGGTGAWAAISTALGIGAVLGGFAGLRWRPARPLRAGVLMFLWGGPPMFVLLALHAPLWTIIVVAVLDGSAGSVFNAFWFTAMQARVRPGDLSRVSSWDSLGTVVLEPVGLAVVGPVAAAAGFSATLYAAAAISVGLTLALLAVRDVRDLGAPEATPAEQ